jgi:eukaryotic-like serine/threonine-protein kinase
MPPREAMSVKRGDILGGRYRIDRVLAVGGNGIVVAAEHVVSRKQFAIKVPLRDELRRRMVTERFLREGRVMTSISSEHVVGVYDIGQLESGAPFLVMEFLDGCDLDSLLQRRGPLPPTEAALYIIQACSALSKVHAAGIVHRDIKPANLFLTRRPDGSPCIKVIDFGISVVMVSDLWQLEPARNVDARSDIWSLGVVLYELATGQPPFRGTDHAEIFAAMHKDAMRPPSEIRDGITPAFDAVVLRCLQRKREERFQSVDELAAALAPLVPDAQQQPTQLLTGEKHTLQVSPSQALRIEDGGSKLRATPQSMPIVVAVTLGGLVLLLLKVFLWLVLR